MKIERFLKTLSKEREFINEANKLRKIYNALFDSIMELDETTQNKIILSTYKKLKNKE